MSAGSLPLEERRSRMARFGRGGTVKAHRKGCSHCRSKRGYYETKAMVFPLCCRHQVYLKTSQLQGVALNVALQSQPVCVRHGEFGIPAQVAVSFAAGRTLVAVRGPPPEALAGVLPSPHLGVRGRAPLGARCPPCPRSACLTDPHHDARSNTPRHTGVYMEESQ